MAGAGAGAGGEAGTGVGAGEEKVEQGKKGASFGDILKESKGDVEIEKEGKVAMQEQDGMSFFYFSFNRKLFTCWIDEHDELIKCS